MHTEIQIPEPFLFNALKHHLGFIREFVYQHTERKEDGDRELIMLKLKHLGNSVIDVYSGLLSINDICCEIKVFLEEKNLSGRELFSHWSGIKMKDYKIIPLSDNSHWTLKYYDSLQRFVHFFPAHGSSHSFRIKSNTLKSALLYNILIGKDFITGDDLNKVRPLLGLSPVKDPLETEAIFEMIEMSRNFSL